MTEDEAIQFYKMILSMGIANQYAEAAKISVSAIQEREERAKSCEYCKGRAYTKKPVTISTIYGKRISMVIEFCPMCGKRLKGNEK